MKIVLLFAIGVSCKSDTLTDSENGFFSNKFVPDILSYAPKMIVNVRNFKTKFNELLLVFYSKLLNEKTRFHIQLVYLQTWETK